ncbi:hypothetical protein Nepgr_031171 [Nepenthes gracilis]|uniref:S-protein homolog n=1 Tax=Nepenthes gracilis TaxID=150966 RepID=A0AAD3TG16_NEPGR|nr:hypothetical protein Nepgr_031171 [Nepenthes gracilis]
MEMDKHFLLVTFVFSSASFLKDCLFISAAADLQGGDQPLMPDNSIHPIFVKTHVQIENSMADRSEITVHCKSKDDDLGVHNIGAGESYGWHFRPNFLGSTLFFCGFNWENKHVVADVYTYERDYGRCYKHCNWIVDETGVHGLNRHGFADVWYKWEINSFNDHNGYFIFNEEN